MDWKHTTIKQFIELDGFIKENDTFEFKVKALQTLTGKNEAEILALTIDEFKELCNKFIFLNTPYNDKAVPYNIRVNGIRFEANLSIKDITGAEFIDLSTFCKDEKSTKDNMHKILAIFYKPKHKWFGFKKVSMDRNKVSDLFYEHLTMDKAYPVAVFFYTLFNSLLKSIATSLEKEQSKMRKYLEKELKKEQAKAMRKNGGGL